MIACHFTMNDRQKITFYLAVIKSIFEHCSVAWRPISSNQMHKFELVQKRAIKWITARQFDHWSDDELYNNRART